MKSSASAASTRKPVIGIQVINLTCSCGGACENENGSTMIEYFDKMVWCSECSQQYEIPASVFQKQWLNAEPEEK